MRNSGYGGTPRDIGRGPSLWQAELGALKQIQLGERVHMQFRGEVFNLFNRAAAGRFLDQHLRTDCKRRQLRAGWHWNAATDSVLLTASVLRSGGVDDVRPEQLFSRCEVLDFANDFADSLRPEARGRAERSASHSSKQLESPLRTEFLWHPPSESRGG